MNAETASIWGATTESKRASVVLSAILAMSFGVFLLYGVGFAGSTTIHNAAHDARHGISFPCH
jgi:cobalt transporter subunit CbtB